MPEGGHRYCGRCKPCHSPRQSEGDSLSDGVRLKKNVEMETLANTRKTYSLLRMNLLIFTVETGRSHSVLPNFDRLTLGMKNYRLPCVAWTAGTLHFCMKCMEYKKYGNNIDAKDEMPDHF